MASTSSIVTSSECFTLSDSIQCSTEVNEIWITVTAISNCNNSIMNSETHYSSLLGSAQCSTKMNEIHTPSTTSEIVVAGTQKMIEWSDKQTELVIAKEHCIPVIPSHSELVLHFRYVAMIIII